MISDKGIARINKRIESIDRVLKDVEERTKVYNAADFEYSLPHRKTVIEIGSCNGPEEVRIPSSGLRLRIT